jgi:hypothetical protein
MHSAENTIISEVNNPPATPATGGKILGPKPSEKLWGGNRVASRELRSSPPTYPIVQATKNMASLHGGQINFSKNPNPSTRKPSQAYEYYRGRREEEEYGEELREGHVL